MRKLRRIWLIGFILWMSFIMVACANEPDYKDETASVDKEESNVSKDLVVATSRDLVSLDPAGSNDTPSSNAQENIYERLVKLNKEMELEPVLATDWEAVDENVWEFTLRKGVVFHDGTDFNAEVVKANIERVQDEKVASPRAFLYTMVDEIEVVDEYTVRFKTEFPFAPLPAHLAHHGGGMVSLKAIEEDMEAMKEGKEPGSVINANPVGTGAFKFEEWEADKHIIFTKNEDYWGDKAKVDTVTLKVVSEDQARIAELMTGEAHIADPISPTDVKQVENEDGLFVNRQGSSRLSYIGFHMEKEPFDDPNVRKAIRMAIDKNQIIDGIYDGNGIPAVGPLAPDVFGYDAEQLGVDYSPEKAMKLLEEAGYENGFKTTLWTHDEREQIDMATNVQAQLKEVGINVEVEVLEWGAYLDQTAKGEHDMFILGWTTVTGDADYGLYALFYSDNVGDTGNRTFTKDVELDTLLDEARRNPNPDERLKLYKQAQDKLNDISPMVYIHHEEYLLGVSDKVTGLEQDPTATLLLQYVEIE